MMCSVRLVVRDRVRTWPDDRHLAGQHLEKLGSLNPSTSVVQSAYQAA